MNPEEYAAQQAVISAAIANYVLQFGKLFAKPALSVYEWLSLLEFLYPQVEFQREQSARLARVFYDSQRAAVYPDLPRNDRLLESYTFERFTGDMEPARKRMSQADAPDDAIGQVALQAVRSVENAGRQQIIHAVREDPALQEIQHYQELGTSTPSPTAPQAPTPLRPETRAVRGWARVATGRETCAWCLMLVSRGPTYLDANTAALDIPNSEALKLWNASAGDLQAFFKEIDPYMEQWHAGCDCKVVPVFKQQTDWVGKDAAARALELWNEATLEAISLEDDPGTHTHGKNKGKKFTRNELALNALRRRLDQGDISPTEFAALAAA